MVKSTFLCGSTEGLFLKRSNSSTGTQNIFVLELVLRYIGKIKIQESLFKYFYSHLNHPIKIISNDLVLKKNKQTRSRIIIPTIKKPKSVEFRLDCSLYTLMFHFVILCFS